MSTDPTPARDEVRQLEITLALAGLETYWRAHPYLRLGQLVSNAVHYEAVQSGHAQSTMADVFLIEDTALLGTIAVLL